MRSKNVGTSDHDVPAISDNLPPLCTLRVRDRRAHQPKRAPSRIGANEEVAARVLRIRAAQLPRKRSGMVVHVILMVRLTRSDDAKFAGRLPRRQKPHLAGRVARDHEQKKRAAARALNFDSKALVGLFINQRVWLTRTG